MLLVRIQHRVGEIHRAALASVTRPFIEHLEQYVETHRMGLFSTSFEQITA